MFGHISNLEQTNLHYTGHPPTWNVPWYIWTINNHKDEHISPPWPCFYIPWRQGNPHHHGLCTHGTPAHAIRSWRSWICFGTIWAINGLYNHIHVIQTEDTLGAYYTNIYGRRCPLCHHQRKYTSENNLPNYAITNRLGTRGEIRIQTTQCIWSTRHVWTTNAVTQTILKW